MLGIRIMDAVGSSLPACVREAVRFLRGAPAGEVYPVTALPARIGYAREYFGHYCMHPALAEFRLRVGARYLYGSKRAILNLRRQLENR